jgi:anti-sigma regulatory factor (Ser/Thr protein kinase)
MGRATEIEIERLELRAPASPGAVPGMRRAVVDFAELHGVGHPPDVALAVSEAVTNAVLHGYRDGASGDLRVVACAEPERLVVVVRDYGVGMRPHPNSPGLGLGLSVSGRPTTEMNIERPDEGGGTRLRMHFANP